MKIFAKFTDKLRKLGKKGKLAICTAMATVGAAAMTVCASAAEVDGTASVPSLKEVLQGAGDSLIISFNDMVQTMIPVVLGIASSGLVIFAIFGLFKLAKKIFGKVTG